MQKPSHEELLELIRRDERDTLARHAHNYRGWLSSMRPSNVVHSAPPFVGYPPRVFVSYRWEDARIKERAKAVAEYLESRGYDVFLDQSDLDEDATIPDIASFVSNIANCSFFLIVSTPGYLESISGRRATWVYDEYKYAVSLASAGMLQMLCIDVVGYTSPPS